MAGADVGGWAIVAIEVCFNGLRPYSTAFRLWSTRFAFGPGRRGHRLAKDGRVACQRHLQAALTYVAVPQVPSSAAKPHPAGRSGLMDTLGGGSVIPCSSTVAIYRSYIIAPARVLLSLSLVRQPLA